MDRRRPVIDRRQGAARRCAWLRKIWPYSVVKAYEGVIFTATSIGTRGGLYSVLIR